MNRKGSGVQLETLEKRSLFSSTISGMVFNEADADGHRESGEPGLANVRVYLDANFNGRLDSNETSTLSAKDGSYSFTGLSAGVFRVRVVTPSGFRQTAPALLYFDVSSSGAESHVANDFGFTDTATVRGTVFRDTNKDGIKESTESGVANVLVYIDKNNNGKFDSKTEKSRLTDSTGAYRFRGLPAGTYNIRIAPGSGVTLISPPAGVFRVKLTEAGTLSNRNFGILT